MESVFFIIGSLVVISVLLIKRTKDYEIKKAEKHKNFKKIAKCVYKVYGDSYPYKSIYDSKESYKEYLRGDSISYIAFNKWRLLGHVAIKENKELKISEIAGAFVNPKYRGGGILNKLTCKAISECEVMGQCGVYVTSVCGHTYSQNVAKKLGFSECALMLCKTIPLDFKNIHEKWECRESLVISFKYLKKVNKKNIFICKKHRKILKEIYNNLGVEVNFLKENYKEKVYCLSSEIKVKKLDDGSALIDIIDAGKNITTEVLSKARELIESGTKSIILTMNLYEKATMFMSEEFEKYGFFFCGVIPGEEGHELFLLQYLTDEVKYEFIYLSTDRGNKLLQYIKNEKDYVDEREDANEF